MTNYSHETAPTQFVETKGIRYALPSFRQTRNGSAAFPGVLQL